MPKTNSSKILKTVALAGALTAAGTVATTARADTTTSDTPAQAPSSVITADQQLADLKSQQAINENQAANSNATTMKAASDAADKQIADINSQIASRQASDAVASQAVMARQTSAINSAAQSATAAENASYSAAVAKQSAANDAALKAAQAKVATEQQKAQQTNQENAVYQGKTDKLAAEHEANINKINADSANQTKNIGQQIAAAQKDAAAARTIALDRATKQVDGQIADAVKNAGAAQETVNNDQQVVNAKQAAVQAAQKAIKDSQAIQTTDKLSVPQDYINVWKKYYADIHGFTLDQKVDADLWQRNKTASAEAKKLNRNFVASDKDKATSVSFNSDGTLSRDDVITVTKYAAELINPIREAIGVAPYQITNASIDTTIENTRQYRAKGHNDWRDSHDGALLKKVGADWGTDALGESLAGDYAISRKLVNKQNVSVADLKEAVHDAVVALLFEGADDSANGHTTDLLGVRYVYSSVLCGGSDFLGVDYDLDPVHQNGWIRFNSIADGKSPRVQNLVKQGYNVREGQPTDKTIQGTNYDKIAVPTPDSQASAAARLSSQLTALFVRTASDDQTGSLQTAAAELMAAQAKLTQDKKILTTAQAKLNELKTSRAKLIQDLVGDPAAPSSIQNLQEQLSQVKVDHDNAIKAENTDYAANLADLKKDHEAKLAAIAAQPANVDALKAELQGQLETLKKGHESRLAAIQDAAKAKLANLKQPTSTADPEIDKLQAKIEAIKANLAKQQATLDDQLAALKAKDQEEYTALEKKLKNSGTEAAKGRNDHYTTADGQQEVILPGNDSRKSEEHQAIKASTDHESPVSEQEAPQPILSATTPAAPTVAADAVKAAVGETVSDNRDAADDNETMTAPAVADNNTVADGSAGEAPAERQTSVDANVPADKVAPVNHEAVKPLSTDNELPQTGDKDGIVAMVLGAMTALFSLGWAAKKRY